MQFQTEQENNSNLNKKVLLKHPNFHDNECVYRYLDYWRERFRSKALAEFCVGIQTNSKETDIGKIDTAAYVRPILFLKYL